MRTHNNMCSVLPSSSSSSVGFCLSISSCCFINLCSFYCIVQFFSFFVSYSFSLLSANSYRNEYGTLNVPASRESNYWIDIEHTSTIGSARIYPVDVSKPKRRVMNTVRALRDFIELMPAIMMRVRIHNRTLSYGMSRIWWGESSCRYPPDGRTTTKELCNFSTLVELLQFQGNLSSCSVVVCASVRTRWDIKTRTGWSLKEFHQRCCCFVQGVVDCY